MALCTQKIFKQFNSHFDKKSLQKCNCGTNEVDMYSRESESQKKAKRMTVCDGKQED